MKDINPLWLPGQPHAYNRTVQKMNNCAVLTNNSGVYGWKVENCSARHPFICTNGKFKLVEINELLHTHLKNRCLYSYISIKGFKRGSNICDLTVSQVAYRQSSNGLRVSSMFFQVHISVL